MNTVLKLFLSMSFSGSLIILVLLLGKRFLKDRVSRQWQYYIWLAAVLRLLIPFGPEVNLMGRAYQAADEAIDRAMARTVSWPQRESALYAPEGAPVSAIGDTDLATGASIPATDGTDLSTGGSASAIGSFASAIDDPDSAIGGTDSAIDDPDSAIGGTDSAIDDLNPVIGGTDSATGDSDPAIDSPVSAIDFGQSEGERGDKAEDLAAVHPLRDIGALLANYAWLIWLGTATGLLIRKVTIYQSFIRYIHAGLTPVSDLEILDRLSVTAEQAGVKKPIEICVNPLISSPLLIGFFHPCIVLPGADISEKDFQYIVLHELTHYRRGDMFYKWLIQVTVCLHWFNPLVHLMSREITKACEFSCDEAVLAKMGGDNARDYGKTLLDAMAAVGRYRENLGSANLSENKQLLKERINAIMNFKKKSKAILIITGALTVCVIFGAAFVGTYPIAAASDQPNDKSLVAEGESGNGTESGTGDGSGSEAGNRTGIENGNGAESRIVYRTETGNGTGSGTENGIGSTAGNGTPAREGTSVKDQDYASQAERYYEAGSLPLFQIVFSRLDEEAQDKWLDRIYADGQIAFWGAAVDQLDEDCSLIQRYADKVYEDGNIAFFSTLSMHMSEQTLEGWLDKALEDGNWSFQSMLYDELDQGDEFDKQEDKREKEWEEAQTAEYQAVGVTMDGKDYYYQGQLVNIFLDIRPNKSFYTLNLNPEGTVNIKIIRDADNRITGVAYMTDEEVTELLENEYDANGDNKGNADDEEENEDGDEEGYGVAMRTKREEDDSGDNGVSADDGGNIKSWPETAGGRTWYPQVMPVELEAIEDESIVYMGEYALSEGDRIWYAVWAETGNGMQIGFAEPDDEILDTTYLSVKSRRQEDGVLECVASFTLRPPVKPGTYKLFLRATDGDLGNIRGSVSIGYVADASRLTSDKI